MDSSTAATAAASTATEIGTAQTAAKIKLHHWRNSASRFDLNADGICFLAFTDSVGRYGYVCIDPTQLFKPDGRYVTVTLDQGAAVGEGRMCVGGTSHFEFTKRFRDHLGRLQLNAGVVALQRHLGLEDIHKQLKMLELDASRAEHEDYYLGLKDALGWARATVDDLESLLRMLDCEAIKHRHCMEKIGIDNVLSRLRNVVTALVALSNAITEFARFRAGDVAKFTFASIWIIRVRDITGRLFGAISAMNKVRDSMAAL